MSRPAMPFDLPLKVLPDEVLFDFLAQSCLALYALDVDDDACERLRIAVDIERSPLADFCHS